MFDDFKLEMPDIKMPDIPDIPDMPNIPGKDLIPGMKKKEQVTIETHKPSNELTGCHLSPNSVTTKS